MSGPPQYTDKYPPPQDAPPPAPYPPSAAYPPSAPYPPQQTTTANTVVVQQAPVAQVVKFGESPMSYNCHICHTQQVTRVSYNPGVLTWILVLILCVLGLWACALIPLCIDGTKDVYHTCPNCNNQVGVYKRM